MANVHREEEELADIQVDCPAVEPLIKQEWL